MADNTIETRIPQTTGWVKEITAVKDRAKTGYDWDGDFINADTLIDMEPGTLIAVEAKAGSRKNPSKDVDLRILMPDGDWTTVEGVVSNEWASELRQTARKYLDADRPKRIKMAAAKALAYWQDIVQKREENKVKIDSAAADLENIVNAALEKGSYLELPQTGATGNWSKWADKKAFPDDALLKLAREHMDRQVILIGERIADAQQNVLKYERMLKGKEGRAAVPFAIKDELGIALAELLVVCGTQEKIVEVLRADGVRRAIKKALKAPVAPEAAEVSAVGGQAAADE